MLLSDNESLKDSLMFYWLSCIYLPDGSVAKNPPANEGGMGWISGLGRSPGEGNGNPFWYSYLGNPSDQRAWQATVLEVTKSST